MLQALADITAVSVARSELDPPSLLLVRLAALIAVDAPESSYLLHVGPAAEVGVTVELAQDVLVAVAPIVGTGYPHGLTGSRSRGRGPTLGPRQAQQTGSVGAERSASQGRVSVALGEYRAASGADQVVR